MANPVKHLAEQFEIAMPKQPALISCIFCRKFSGSKGSLRQHWCPCLDPEPGRKTKSRQLNHDQWQACLDAAAGIRPVVNQKGRRLRALPLNPWSAL